MKTRKMAKICFVSLNAYPLLKKIDKGFVGGREKQLVEIAKELENRGYEIIFLTYGKKYNQLEIHENIKIYHTYEREKVNELSFFKKMIYIWEKLKVIDADVYIYGSGSPGIISVYTRLLRKKSIYSISSDADVTTKIIIKNNNFSGFMSKIGTFIDLFLSDYVLTQNNFQQEKIKSLKKSKIVKSAINLTSADTKTKDSLIWIGTIREIKQPKLFLKIAQIFPDYNFIMIGGIGENQKLYDSIKNNSKKYPNLNFKGFVPQYEINKYYKRAICLISTSLTEGFPNVFLESWNFQVPVVSLNIDPDGIIKKYSMGYHSRTFDQMVKDINKILENEELRECMGKNGRRYVEKNHSTKIITDKYEKIIDEILLSKLD